MSINAETAWTFIVLPHFIRKAFLKKTVKPIVLGLNTERNGQQLVADIAQNVESFLLQSIKSVEKRMFIDKLTSVACCPVADVTIALDFWFLFSSNPDLCINLAELQKSPLSHTVSMQC